MSGFCQEPPLKGLPRYGRLYVECMLGINERLRAAGQSEISWTRYPDGKDLGTAPALTDLDHDDHGRAVPACTKQLTDLRTAVWFLAEFGFFINPATGNPFNWYGDNPDNLYHVALGVDEYNWKTTPSDGSPTYDIELEEIVKCLQALTWTRLTPSAATSYYSESTSQYKATKQIAIDDLWTALNPAFTDLVLGTVSGQGGWVRQHSASQYSIGGGGAPWTPEFARNRYALTIPDVEIAGAQIRVLVSNYFQEPGVRVKLADWTAYAYVGTSATEAWNYGTLLGSLAVNSLNVGSTEVIPCSACENLTRGAVNYVQLRGWESKPNELAAMDWTGNIWLGYLAGVGGGGPGVVFEIDWLFTYR